MHMNIKKALSLVIALTMVFTMAISASAYSTTAKYTATMSSQKVDVDGDGTAEYLPTADAPYGISVPAEITVGSGSGKVRIAGYTDAAVTISAPASVQMKQDGKPSNTLNANVTMTNVVLPISIAAPGEAEQNVSASWGTAPSLGSWTGTFEYTVNTAA